MKYLYIEKIVEIDTVAAGTHTERKRAMFLTWLVIDYMQIYIAEKNLVIVSAVVDTMLSAPSYT